MSVLWFGLVLLWLVSSAQFVGPLTTQNALRKDTGGQMASFWCPLYRGFHHFDTPNHVDALDSVEVIQKCRCGETRTSIRYVPLPDTVEWDQYKGGEEVEEEEESSPLYYLLLVVIVLGVLALVKFIGVAAEYGNFTGGGP